MGKELNILIVEDEPADVVLINHQLRKAGIPFRTHRVETCEDFIQSLQSDPPDVILSDSALPNFAGHSALAIARDLSPDTPFIFVTGSLGEERAIEVLRGGATDYVLKNRLVNLVPAMQRALRESQERVRRQRSEQALKESEERFRMLIEGVKDYAIFVLDPSGCVSSWNAGAEWISGYAASDILGQPLSVIYPADGQPERASREALRLAAARGRFEEEGWRIRKGGTRFWANIVITALHDETGQLRGFAHVMRDFTERRRVEEALRRSEARNAAIVATALDGIISIDHEGQVQEWNPAAERIFGYPRSAAIGRTMEELIIPPSLRELYRDGLAEYLMTGVGSLLGRPIELTAIRSDLSELRVEMAFTRIPAQEPPSYACFIRDITEQKAAEVALRKSEGLYRAITTNIPNGGVAVFDRELRYLVVDGKHPLETLGLSQAQLQGKTIFEIFPPAVCARIEPVYRAALNGQVITAEIPFDQYTYLLTVTPLCDGQDEIYAGLAVGLDITTAKAAADQVRALNAELEERVAERTAELRRTNEELESFSYSISHDLRAPLLHIQGFVEMLEAKAAGSLDSEGRELLQIIAESGRRMGRLIDDLLEFSRMARAEMQRRKVRLGEIVQAVRSQLIRETAGRKIEWIIGELPEVRGDPSLLHQALLNLLSNALKYTRPAAQARIEIGCIEYGDGYEVYIRDNGVGFDMTYANKLFGVFQRLHRASEFEGTGIGLANVRRIIERHGGRIWAEGAVNQGATFSFTLPKPKANHDDSSSIHPPG